MSPKSPADPKLERSADVQLIWILSLFVVLTAGLLASPVSRVALYLYPAMAFAVAIYTYVRSKPTYASLVCWLWLLTPLVRRLVDWRAGWIPATAVLTAPMLACYAPLPFMLYDWKKLVYRATPVLVAASAVVYGVMVGILNHNKLALTASAFAFWSSPICFALFLCHHRATAKDIFLSVQTAFLLSLPLLSLYGLVQFFFLPAWDSLWIENADLVSIGTAAPLQFRVFGTMNSPQVFGAFLVAELFFTFQSKSKWKIVSLPLGLMALALTGARSAWMGFAIGLVYLFFHLPARQRFQVASSAALAAVLLLGAVQSDDAKQLLFSRFESLSDPSHDNSLGSRYGGYLVLLPRTLEEPYGAGVGYDETKEQKGTEGLAGGDSALISILLSFGLIGSFIYLAGLWMVVKGTLGSPSTDGVTVLKACALALASESLFTDTFQGPGGFLVWTSVALCFTLATRAAIPPKQIKFPNLRTQLSTNPAVRQ